MMEKNIVINLPKDVEYILNKLHQSGYEAYVVGGCVRDSVLGKEPHDWDICTNAKPEETYKVFNKEHIIPTGMQHGTITVMKNHEGYEVTTFRTDGDYSDGRHPDDVEFVNDIKEDLARRDFTINAMAYSKETGLVDPFNGYEDLNNKVLQCVGNPYERFNEDALRIMRAIRFASVYNLKIAETTAQAIDDLASNLTKVSKERVTDELTKLFSKADKPGQYLNDFKKVVFTVVPELEVTDGFEQRTPWHQYDVFTHTTNVIDNVPLEKGDNLALVRFAALLHDVGKPVSCTEDRNGNRHFYNHAQKSRDIAESALKENFRLPTKTARTILQLIDNHSEPMIDTQKAIRRWISELGQDNLSLLLAMKQADIMGYGTNTPKHKEAMKVYEQLEHCKQINSQMDLNQECTKITDLKINGADLIQMGVKPGPLMGEILSTMFEKVLNEELSNDRDALMNAVVEEYLSSSSSLPQQGNNEEEIDEEEEETEI